MRRIINHEVYDTATATYLGCFHYGEGSQETWESLYLNPNGKFFLHCRGKPHSRYGNVKNGKPCSGERIILLNDEKGLEWAEQLLTEDKFQTIKIRARERIS